MTPPPRLPPTLEGRDSPYQGLQPYTEKDREYFFGREEDQQTILANLLTTPLTVLYGASGVGKSSVLMAGVVPLLRQTPGLAVVTFRSWQHADLIPALMREVLSAITAASGTASAAAVPALPFDQFLARVTRATGLTLVFIFDQFEEYFLYHPPSDSEADFEVAFARIVNRDDIPANFLLSLREEGLGKLDRFQGRIPNLLNNLLRLDHLSLPGAANAIRQPLAVFNRQHPPEQRMEVEAALVDAVLNQVQAGRVTLGRETPQAGANLGARATHGPSVETPFLQMVLLRLWQTEVRQGSRCLRKATLDSLGGAQTIVRTHLDEAMTTLSEAEQTLAAGVFHYLVTPSGTKIAHTIEDLGAYAQVPPNQLSPILEKLGRADLRILRRVAPPPEQAQVVRYEIYHDVLAAAVLDWRSRFLLRQNLARQQSLEERLRRERAEAQKQLAWLPWLAGYVVDLFICLPAGALLTPAMLQSRSPQFSPQGLTALRVIWACVGLLSTFVLFLLSGIIGTIMGNRIAPGQTAEDANLWIGIIAVTLAVPRALAAPLICWLVYRAQVRRWCAPPT